MTLSSRRPFLMVAVAGLIFAVVLGYRLSQPPTLSAPQQQSQGRGGVVVSTQTQIARLQDRLRQNPDDTNSYAQLGIAMIQRVRETADPNLYTQAGQAFQEALKRNPKQLQALIGMGSLSLSLHEFKRAVDWGEKAREVSPSSAAIYGIIGDGLLELGRYDDAVATIQKMVDTRPGITSYTRVSYVRELYGDIPGAIEAMRQAANAGAPGSEGTFWSQVYLGNLYFNKGDVKTAEMIYDDTLRQQPAYPYALAGMARVRAAQGRYDEALSLYQTVVERLPLPQFAIALGEVYDKVGQPKQAKAQYDLVRVIQTLNASAAMNTDLEMSWFESDYGDPARGLKLARAAYAQRRSIYVLDALAWALYRNGQYDEAWTYAQQALKLGTRDAMLYFHAGMIAAELDPAKAQQYLRTALEINPNFSVRFAPQAKAALDQLAQ